MNWLLARLKEPSTWAGLGTVIAAVGTAFPSTAVATIPAGVVFGALAASMKEKAHA